MRPRVGVIGIGQWGKHLVRVFADQASVVLCSNRSDPEAQAWVRGHYPDVRTTFDVEEVLQDGTLQAVVIATPIRTHVELTLRALAAGKHVFVEKPLAMSEAEARRVLQAARQSRRVVFVGHVFRYHPVVQYLSAIAREDPPRLVRMVWWKFGTFEEPVVWNLLPHEVAIACEFFRELPSEVQVLDQWGILTAADFVRARLGFSAARTCNVEVNRCLPFRHKSAMLVTNSGRYLVWEAQALYELKGAGRFETLFESSEEPLTREVQAFLSQITDGTEATSSDEFELGVVRVLEQLDRDVRGPRRQAEGDRAKA